MTNDRRKLEDWERAECAALKAAIADLNARTGHVFTQEYLAHELGTTQGAVNSHLNGRRAINKNMAAKIATATGIAIEQFSPRLAREITAMAAAASLGQQDQPSPTITIPVVRFITSAAMDGRLDADDLEQLRSLAAHLARKARRATPGDGHPGESS